MVKTIFNNLGNDVKGLIKYERGIQCNKTNDKTIINENRIKIYIKCVSNNAQWVCSVNQIGARKIEKLKILYLAQIWSKLLWNYHLVIVGTLLILWKSFD